MIRGDNFHPLFPSPLGSSPSSLPLFPFHSFSPTLHSSFPSPPLILSIALPAPIPSLVLSSFPSPSFLSSSPTPTPSSPLPSLPPTLVLHPLTQIRPPKSRKTPVRDIIASSPPQSIADLTIPSPVPSPVPASSLPLHSVVFSTVTTSPTSVMMSVQTSRTNTQTVNTLTPTQLRVKTAVAIQQHPVFARTDTSAYVAHAWVPSISPPPPHPHPPVPSPAMTTAASRPTDASSARADSLAGDLARNLRDGLPNDLPVIDGDISNVIGGHARDLEDAETGMLDHPQSRPQPSHESERGMVDPHPHSERNHRDDGKKISPFYRTSSSPAAAQKRKRGVDSDVSQPNSPILGQRKQHGPNRQRLKMLGTKSSLSELYSRDTS